MLQITVKSEIKPTKSQSKYTLESQSEEEINQFTDSKLPIDLDKIKQYYKDRSSINAEILAMFISKILVNLSEANQNESMSLLLSLIACPHDERELLHVMKNKFKIDANLLLVALWDYRSEKNAVKLVGILLDCYPLQLMLNGKQISLLWKNIQCKQELLLKITQREQNQRVKTNNIGHFRTISIPL